MSLEAESKRGRFAGGMVRADPAIWDGRAG
jgi:hypothetical protein